MMRVTYVSTSFPLGPDSSSGVFVKRLVENLAGKIDATVIAPGGVRPVEVDPGVAWRLRTFRYAPWRWQILAHQPGGIPVALKRSKWAFLLVPPFLAAMLLACLRAAPRTDIFHANWAICGLIAGLVAKLSGRRLVTTLRGDDFTRAAKSLPDRWILGSCLRLSDRVVTVSEAILAGLRERYPRYADKMSMVPNGVDERFYALPLADADAGQGPGLRCVTIGSLIPRKGVDQILEAMAKLAPGQASLTVVGAGPEEQALRELTRRLGLESCVTFIGARAPERIVELLRAVDVLLLASHSEGRPNVVLEAMAAGLPVIATDIDGVNELVRHGETGWLFPDGDISLFSRHLADLSANPRRRLAFGRAGREFMLARGLRWTLSAARYADVYTRCLED